MRLKSFWLISLLAAASCSGEFDFREQAPSSLEISTDRISFDPSAGQVELKIVSPESWTAELAEPCGWLSFTTGTSSLTVSVTENKDLVLRSGTILIHSSGRSSSIRVIQSGSEGTITVSADTLIADYGAYCEDVTVEASIAWTAYAPASWISTTVNGNKLTVSMSENQGDSRRSSYILIQNNGLSLKRIFVSQASSVPPVPEYYRISIPEVDWSKSRIFYATNENADTIAVLTRELSGRLAGTAAEFLYPYSGGKADFSKGTKSESDCFWIKKDGSAFYTANPASRFDAVETAALKVLGLKSDVKMHGSVKVGDQIWLMEDYKTTTLADGTPIDIYYEGDKFWTAGSKAIAIYNAGGVDHYLYTGYCLDGFAPEGWSLPTQEDYLQTLLLYVGSFESLTGVSQFGATLNYKCTNSSGAKFTALGYTNTWTCNPNGAKMYMVGLKPDGGNVNSAQALTGCFAIRLIKK